MDDMEKKCGLYVGQRFSAWKDAEVALDNYCESRLFQWTTKTSCTVKNENVKLQSRQETELYSEELEYKNIVLTCASGGPKRINRGKGERPIQATWKIECPAKVQLIATKNYLQIEKFVETHNHECTQAYYDSLPKTRRKKLMHENTVSTAKTLLTAGVKPCVVRSTLRSLGCDRIQARDLSNLRAKWKREKMGGKTPEQKLAETIQQLLQADSQAYVHTGKGEDGDLVFLFVQTSAMRAVVEKFGTVILLDHTYKINKAGMPVTVFMCMDGNGNGRAAGYAFIANEKSVTIEKVLQCFVSVIGDKVASAIQTVVIDKDYSEVKGIRNVLPNVHIQLCDFHVKRTFDARVKKFKETEKVSSLLTQLRFCGDEKEFDQLTAQLESESSELFFQYFKENWMLCSLAWSFRDKKKSANLGNNTNNRLENHNSKIKMMLSPNLELFEALEKLIELVLNKEDDVFFQCNMDSMKETYHMHCDDPMVKEILNDLTRFAAKLLLWEMKQTVVEADLVAYKTDSSSCNCPHWHSYHLPCRHIILHRRLHGEPVYKPGEVDKRWHKSYQLSDMPQQSELKALKVVCSVVPSKMIPYKWNDKYNHCKAQCEVLCGIMAECGQDLYMERYNQLVELGEMWSAGKQVVLAEVSNISKISGFHFTSATNMVIKAESSSTETPECDLNVVTKADSSPTKTPDSDPGFENDKKTSPTAERNSGLISLDSSMDTLKMSPITKSSSNRSERQRFNSLQSESHTSCEGSTLHFGAPESYLCSDNMNVRSKSSMSSMLSNDESEASLGIDESILLTTAYKQTSSVEVRNQGQILSLTPEKNLSTIASPTPDSELIPVVTSDNSNFGKPTTSVCSPTFMNLPDCFCRVPAIRLTAGPSSKIAGRPFYKCARNRCRFWRLAPTTPKTTPTKTKPKIAVKHQNEDRTPNIESMLEDDDEVLKDLLSIFDELETSAHIADGSSSTNPTQDLDSNPAGSHSAAIPFPGLMSEDKSQNADDEVETSADGISSRNPTQDLDSNLAESHPAAIPSPGFISEDNSQNPDDTSTTTSDLFSMLAGIKIPRGIKHKGRPQGFGKTIPDWKKGSKGSRQLSLKPPSGTVLKPTNVDDEDARYHRGCAIPDDDVEEIDEKSWKVRSQGKNTSQAYLVSRVNWDDSCGMCGKAPCVHSFTCQCPDHVHRRATCKHVHKIYDYVFKRSGNSRVSDSSVGKRTNAESGFSLHPNVTVRAKKAKLHSSLIEYPWDHCNQEERFDQNFDYHVANYQFSQGDYDSLSGSSWLTDRVIDCFMALALSSDFLSNSEASVLVLDSMVLECATMGLQSVFERAIRSKFLFNDVWIVPTHVQRNHWILIVVLIRTKKVIILDPFGGRVSDSVEEHIQIVRHMLSLSHSDIFKNEIAWNEWEFTAPSDMGSQSNSYDCGVCVCVWTYFISTGLTPPSVQEICASSTAVRTWMKNLLLSKAVKTERLKPQKFKAEDEHIVAVYSDFDKGVSSGSVKIEKPWLSLPAPVVSRDLVGGSRTVDFLATIMRNLWEATDTFCGAKRCKRGILAYFCEGCREFFHLGCIGDLRKPPEQGDYMCPKHIIVKTRTREACRPVRFRRSLE